MIFKSLKALATAALFSAALPLAGQAADIAPVPDTSDWSFTAAAYVWGAGLSGDVGVFGLPPQDVDLPFSDIIGSLDFAFMGLAEARKDRFMLGVDLTYTNVGKTVETDGANRYFFGGRIEEEAIKGWGYTRYVVGKLGPMAGTLMAVDPNAPKVARFVTLGDAPHIIRYNSRLPVVVYVPEGVEVRYRIWTAGAEVKAIGKG